MEFELDADLVQRPGGAINDGVDKTDRHCIGMQRLRRNFAQPLTEELEGVSGIVADGDERFRTKDEGDASDVRRILGLADHAGVQVANAILGVIRFRGFGEIGIGARRHFAAKIALYLLVLIQGRLDHVDPDRARRNWLNGVKNLPLEPDARRRPRNGVGFDGIVDNQHGSTSASAKALPRNYMNSHRFACRQPAR